MSLTSLCYRNPSLITLAGWLGGKRTSTIPCVRHVFGDLSKDGSRLDSFDTKNTTNSVLTVSAFNEADSCELRSCVRRLDVEPWRRCTYGFVHDDLLLTDMFYIGCKPTCHLLKVKEEERDRS